MSIVHVARDSATGRRFLAALLLVVSAACGVSSKEIKTARSVVYRAEFPIVWNAVAAIVRNENPNLAVDNATRGVIVTDWKQIEQDSQDQQTDEDLEKANIKSTTGEATALHSGLWFRLRVAVTGRDNRPPWTVTVEGEAARFRPEFANPIQPIARGAGDEPPWVQQRIDGAQVRVYRKLKRYAVPVVVASAAPASEQRDTSPWSNLPPSAANVIAEVHAGAAKRDPAGLGLYMAESIQLDGEEMPQDQVLAIWRADPSMLAVLAKALESECTETELDAKIECPAPSTGAPASAPAGRAEWRRVDGAWKLSGVSR